MEHQDSLQNQKESDRTRERYEAPKATFVPLKMEERLLACNKSFLNAGGPNPCTQLNIS